MHDIENHVVTMLISPDIIYYIASIIVYIIIHTLFGNNTHEGASKSLRNVQSRLFSAPWY